MAGENRQCVLFLTDSSLPRIVRHFERLADESPFQAFFCLSEQHHSHAAGVRLDYQSAGTRFRFRRPARPLHEERPFMPGTLDLLWLETIAAISQKHVFDFFWIVEFDVDFSGHWSRFFEAFVDNGSDLLASYLVHRHSYPDWTWWRSFSPPQEVACEHHVRGTLQVTRLSSRLLARLNEVYDGSPCSGHIEALLPTLCSYFGMVLEDISGKSPFGRGQKWMEWPHTFKTNRAGMPNSYFEEDPTLFDRPNMLWHLVKVAGTPNKKSLGTKL